MCLILLVLFDEEKGLNAPGCCHFCLNAGKDFLRRYFRLTAQNKHLRNPFSVGTLSLSQYDMQCRILQNSIIDMEMHRVIAVCIPQVNGSKLAGKVIEEWRLNCQNKLLAQPLK